MNENMKAYYKEFGSAMAAYTIAVPLSIWLLRRNPALPLRVVFALLPVIPAAFAMWAGIRFFRRLDELQRRIQVEAIAFSFLATCLLSLTWGFLQNAGLPHMDVIFIAPLLILLWWLGMAMATRRYQ